MRPAVALMPRSSPRSRLAAALAAAAAALAAAVPGASAAITGGETSSSATPCIGPFIVLQTHVGVAPGYVVPAGRGVVTAWSLNNSGASAGPVRLKLVRPGLGTSYVVVGQDARRTVAGGVPNTFLTRLPVHGGETPALWLPTSAPVSCIFSSSNARDIYNVAVPSGEPQPGQTFDAGAG